MNNITNNFRFLAGKGLARVGDKTIKLSRRLIYSSPLNLSGDRDIEWSWVISELPKGNCEILDFGPGVFELVSLTAARNDSKVTCFDVRQIKPQIEHKNIEYLTGDILAHNFNGQVFNCIINTSTIEHIGMGRYGDRENPDGDIIAMQKLKGLLKPDGKMILTIPIGLDKIHGNLYRVYGNKRLEMLLKGFKEIKSEFWAKGETLRWQRVTKEQALGVQSYPYYYALGLFVLSKKT
jgi:2-polyprenyl-3-methyl-5-hydroxy-6-metoxy-1,4-benzoquinol methylase